ncbi:hypothetical protein COU36_01290 [Candidatus Micrarchaeota archaeon CG10_big_fil_rev_8_21_14_0_10_59_7]|nr:MAG: hypothetical protein COU36_01290 [Candidatus Micrarchaeota archaeon CG10_big_fil_rev_8_21_14_0_10_59_7]
MAPSVSDTVFEILSEMYVLRYGFRHDLINYSALARFIQPMVAERMKEEAGLDSIIMAIRRYAQSGVFNSDYKSINAALVGCKLNVRTDMCYITYHRSDEIYRALLGVEHSVDWIGGEKMYIIQRSDEITVVAMSRFLQKLKDIAKGNGRRIKDVAEDLALITITRSQKNVYTPGVLELLCGQLAGNGVNILSIFASFGYISFLMDSKDAAAAYDKLNSTIIAAEEFGKS